VILISVSIVVCDNNLLAFNECDRKYKGQVPTIFITQIFNFRSFFVLTRNYHINRAVLKVTVPKLLFI
jgi:hypothetical protein